MKAILFRITMVPANPSVPLEGHEVAPETKAPCKTDALFCDKAGATRVNKKDHADPSA